MADDKRTPAPETPALDTPTASPESMAPQDPRPKRTVIERAYRDELFLRTPEARPLRILAEYLEPLRRFNRYRVEDTIVFFGSARIQSRERNEAALEAARAAGVELEQFEARLALSRYYEETRELARRLTEWSKGLGEGERRFVVCSGGGPGIMEAANRGAEDAGAVSIGFNITLPHEQEPNAFSTPDLTFRFHYFAMRKMHLAMRASALVAFPGGFGTLDELFEILTLTQTGKMSPVPVILYDSSFWKGLFNLERLAEAGLIRKEDLELFCYADSPEEAYARIVEGAGDDWIPAAADSVQT